MTMWQSGMGGHGGKNNAWMKLMGIVHKERRHHESGAISADRTLSQGLGTGRTGNYRLCLTDKTLSLIKKDDTNCVIHLQLTNIRSCGSLKNYFFLEQAEALPPRSATSARSPCLSLATSRRRRRRFLPPPGHMRDPAPALTAPPPPPPLPPPLSARL
ncbi:unnamed protein product [Phaedon cochleariae]|uniref:IRS-type PTB domain-containing protein n=1 Tax=Phaedon cochleariae TaxID=80249 RepID=A0A9N9SGA3_PHACE|nr:unnamed protein product [Phaedon cochleariae]